MKGFLSRKFILALLILAIGTGMTWMGLLTDQLLDLLKWIGGLYFGFNVSQKASEWIATAVKRTSTNKEE